MTDLSATNPTSPRMPTPTLYDQIGGEDSIHDLIDDFYARVVADDLLAPYFAHIPMDKLRHMQKEFFAAALGGPVAYAGRDVHSAHAGLGIDAKSFARFVGHLLDVLTEAGFDKDMTQEVIDTIALYSDDIVGSGYGEEG